MDNHHELIEQAQRVLGYTFDDPDLIVRALTHASVAHGRLESNERLEFLGDAVLGMIVAERLVNTIRPERRRSGSARASAISTARCRTRSRRPRSSPRSPRSISTPGWLPSSDG